MKSDIEMNPLAFRESFFAEASRTKADIEFGAVINVILYYLWRGCSLSREAGITGETDPKASLLAQSAYEAALSILQLIRMGYHADAITLLRAMMERIAIIGYIGENRHLIARYSRGELSLYKVALTWAKKKSLPNWMNLYSTLSGVAHSNIVGPAGHINNRNEIGNAFRLATKKYPIGSDIIEELLGLTVYSLIALDTFALELIQNSSVKPFPNDTGMGKYVDKKDVNKFVAFLQTFVDLYK